MSVQSSTLFTLNGIQVADEITMPRAEGEDEVEKIQVMLFSEGNPASIRDLSAESVAKLVKIPGIVVAASGIRAKATRISMQCRSCRTVIPNVRVIS